MKLPAGLDTALQPWRDQMGALAERIDRLALRERGLLFGAAILLLYMGWQTFLMDPLMTRARNAGARLEEARLREEAAAASSTEADQDPAVLAVTRDQALRERLAVLDAELGTAAQGYVPPQRMAELLRALLDNRSGLHLVTLRNLPVENLAVQPSTQEPGAAAPVAPLATAPARGPFLHPVEMVLEGDFASLVNYLQALEGLPWRLHWRVLDISTLQHPNNRIRIEIGTLSLSRDWMTV